MKKKILWIVELTLMVTILWHSGEILVRRFVFLQIPTSISSAAVYLLLVFNVCFIFRWWVQRRARRRPA